nr:MbnP family protein [uncultured Arsenicibacter sp.]
MKSILSFVVAAVLAVTIFSCSKTEVDSIDPNGTGGLTLEFDNYVGGTNMALGTAQYKNTAGESFTVTTFNYFVSNIELTKEDGTVVKVPNSYYLVREADPKSLNVSLTGIPQANYAKVAFTVGVDSLKSQAPVTERTGGLDTGSYGTDNMYWSWNSGYIFMKLEGISPASTLSSKAFQYHIGGYGGGFQGAAKTANNLRKITLPLGTTSAKVRTTTTPTVHLIVDAARALGGTNTISFAATPTVHSPALAKPIVDNYVNMFVVDHVHND